nr:MAG TPA: hypothetical protein [Caudoviricetes sp.]
MRRSCPQGFLAETLPRETLIKRPDRPSHRCCLEKSRRETRDCSSDVNRRFRIGEV